MPVIAPLNPQTPIVDKDTNGDLNGNVSTYFRKWLLAQSQVIQNSPQVLKVLNLTSQTASITTTNFTLGALASGTFRVSWNARVTIPAGTSSSLSVTIGYTDLGIPITRTSTAITGNTTTTVQSDFVVFPSDSSSPISYATTYASNPAAAMTYEVRFIVEQLS
jgi:hypothetical protein